MKIFLLEWGEVGFESFEILKLFYSDSVIVQFAHGSPYRSAV